MSTNSSLALTSQFRFCGNCFRLDSYRGCNFGCKYCIINAKMNSCLKGNTSETTPVSNNPSHLALMLKQNEDEVAKSNKFIWTLAHNRVPLHFGGISDPFNYFERRCETTLEMMKILNRHNYPFMLSTKGGIKQVTNTHLNLCDKDTSVFQISITSLHQNFVHVIEKSSPPVKERIQLIHKLKDKGYWVSIRIQPLVHLEDAMEIVDKYSSLVNFITVEHLKIMPCNWTKMRELLKVVGFSAARNFHHTRYIYEMYSEIKYRNIMELKKVCKCKMGVGDNSLHYLSDSFNCCGIDCINPNFDNWLKYNTMAIYLGLKTQPVTDIPLSESRASRIPKHNTKPLQYFVDKFKPIYNRQLYRDIKPLLDAVKSPARDE